MTDTMTGPPVDHTEMWTVLTDFSRLLQALEEYAGPALVGPLLDMPSRVAGAYESATTALHQAHQNASLAVEHLQQQLEEQAAAFEVVVEALRTAHSALGMTDIAEADHLRVYDELTTLLERIAAGEHIGVPA